MMPDGDRKPQAGETDPAQLAKLLEIELMQKRAAWQQARARRGNLRALSLFFFLVVIAGAIAAFFFLFSSGRVQELRSEHPHATPSPAVSPAR